MKIYCINLRRSTDRRMKMEAELSKLPFACEFVDAVDGKALSKDEVDKVYSKWRTRFRIGRGLMPGEIGCALSHLKVYRKLLESSDKCLFIFEDDVTIGDGTASALDDIASFLSDTDVPAVVQLSGNVHEKVPVARGGERFVEFSSALGTYAYGVNRSAASMLLKEYNVIKMTIDNYIYMNRRRGLKIYRYCDKVLSVDTEGESTVADVKFDYSKKPVKLFFWRIWRAVGLTVDWIISSSSR